MTKIEVTINRERRTLKYFSHWNDIMTGGDKYSEGRKLEQGRVGGMRRSLRASERRCLSEASLG